MSFEDEFNFCLKFLNELESAKKSCIYSPLSILNALTMILAGSNGKTAEEILNTISKEKNTDALFIYLSEICRRFKIDKGEKDALSSPAAKRFKKDFLSDIETFKLIIANGLFMNENAEILKEYEKTVKEKHMGHLQKLNFKKDKNESVKVINKFVNDVTNTKINKVISANDLDDDTAVVIVNAVYFAGKWARGFTETFTAVFYSSPRRQHHHPMMSGYFFNINFTEGNDWECAGIPYKKREIWFFVVLPKKRNGLNELIKKLDYALFQKFIENEADTLTITMPIFEIEADYDLTQILPNLGIQNMFHESCNFSKMLEFSQPVSKAVHKAIIKVNEYGTEAAAVTVSLTAPVCGGHDKHMKVNHPFMYFIVESEGFDDNHLGARNILFAGTYC